MNGSAGFGPVDFDPSMDQEDSKDGFEKFFHGEGSEGAAPNHSPIICDGGEMSIQGWGFFESL